MKKLTVVLTAFIVLVSSFSAFADFSAWESEDNIMSLLSELEIMQGDPDGNYRLDDPVSRAECAKIAVSASLYKNSVALGTKTSPFSDVPAGHWAAPYIQTGVKNGLCSGYIDSTFRPDGQVLFEEAVTMMLKVLGYTDSDFGASWPYGQLGIAKQTGLTDRLSKNIGEPMTRRDVMYLCYNLLNTAPKNGNADYINMLDYKILDDAVLIASPNEDSSVGSGKIFTSAGTFKVKDDFNYENIGRKGDLIVKNTDEAVGFIPSEQRVKTYNIYQILNDKIIVKESGSMESVDLDSTLTVYNKSQRTTLGTVSAYVSVGDVLTVYSNSAGVKDYGIIKTDELKGPFTYRGASQIASWGLENPSVTRNGAASAVSELKANDIIYYSSQINSLWSYSKTATGIYEKAIPNKDNPTSVVVSNVTYKLESAEAFNKLSSNGNIEYGDRITLLLGRNNDIADVLFGELDSEEVYGYITETGKQQYIRDDNSTYVSNYIKLALPSCEVREYTVNAQYDSYINSVVKLNFKDGTGKISKHTSKYDISGTVSFKERKTGNIPFASDVQIIDVSTVDASETGAFSKVFLQRLDGVKINSKDILYCKRNSAGEITEMILNNVTGDTFSYGIVTKAQSVSAGMIVTGVYSLDIGGKTSTVQSSSAVYNVTNGQPAKIFMTNTGIQSLEALKRVSQAVTSVTSEAVKAGTSEYPLWDKATVYKKDALGNFTIIPLNDIVGNKNYTLTAYYDKEPSAGGCVRIIIAK